MLKPMRSKRIMIRRPWQRATLASMTTYFTSKAPSRSGKRGNASISDLQIDLSTVDTSAELQKLPPKNVEAKKQLLAKHTADFHKWLLPLR